MSTQSVTSYSIPMPSSNSISHIPPGKPLPPKPDEVTVIVQETMQEVLRNLPDPSVPRPTLKAATLASSTFDLFDDIKITPPSLKASLFEFFDFLQKVLTPEVCLKGTAAATGVAAFGAMFAKVIQGKEWTKEAIGAVDAFVAMITGGIDDITQKLPPQAEAYMNNLYSVTLNAAIEQMNTQYAQAQIFINAQGKLVENTMNAGLQTIETMQRETNLKIAQYDATLSAWDMCVKINNPVGSDYDVCVPRPPGFPLIPNTNLPRLTIKMVNWVLGNITTAFPDWPPFPDTSAAAINYAQYKGNGVYAPGPIYTGSEGTVNKAFSPAELAAIIGLCIAAVGVSLIAAKLLIPRVSRCFKKCIGPAHVPCVSKAERLASKKGPIGMLTDGWIYKLLLISPFLILAGYYLMLWTNKVAGEAQGDMRDFDSMVKDKVVNPYNSYSKEVIGAAMDYSASCAAMGNEAIQGMLESALQELANLGNSWYEDVTNSMNGIADQCQSQGVPYPHVPLEKLSVASYAANIQFLPDVTDLLSESMAEVPENILAIAKVAGPAVKAFEKLFLGLSVFFLAAGITGVFWPLSRIATAAVREATHPDNDEEKGVELPEQN